MLRIIFALACLSSLSYAATALAVEKKVAEDKFSLDLQAALDAIPFEKLPYYFKIQLKEDKYSYIFNFKPISFLCYVY